GHIVADHLRRKAADEDRAGIVDERGQRVGFTRRYLEMLRCEAVNDRRRLGEAANEDDRAETLPAGAGERGAWQDGKFGLDGLLHGACKIAIISDENGLRRLVMLGLGEEVRGDPGWIVVTVGDNHDFRRTRDHVDADLAEDLALGGSNI